MFGRSAQIWKKYPHNVTAVNNKEALYLLHYLSYVRITRSHLPLIEIIDLQRYRLIRKKHLVSRILADNEMLFLFPVIKN